MVLFPLMYPDLFKKFKTRPAKGVLFHGPPGTGKTLLARALANECSLVGGRKVAFFMRKGADCLKKWVGESERHLKLLFQQVIYNDLWTTNSIYTSSMSLHLDTHSEHLNFVTTCMYNTNRSQASV